MHRSRLQRPHARFERGRIRSAPARPQERRSRRTRQRGRGRECRAGFGEGGERRGDFGERRNCRECFGKNRSRRRRFGEGRSLRRSGERGGRRGYGCGRGLRRFGKGENCRSRFRKSRSGPRPLACGACILPGRSRTGLALPLFPAANEGPPVADGPAACLPAAGLAPVEEAPGVYAIAALPAVEFHFREGRGPEPCR